MELGCYMQVLPALGAEQVVEHCGGLRCVLRAIGVDVSAASPRDDRCVIAITPGQWD